MNAHRMDQETAERLLGGPTVDAQDGPEVLVQLLAAVRAAPHPHELSGEGAALQAFRMARAGSVPAAARPERRLLTSLLAAKLALAALLAAGTGGVALAAVTGALPGPFGTGGATTTPSGGDDRPSSTGDPGGSPTPAAPTARPGSLAALAELCTAYRAQPGEDRRGSLETPRFADLVAAAGGREKVPGYCNQLLDGRGSPGGPNPGPTKRPQTTRGPDRPPSAPAGTVAPTTRPAGPTVNRPATVGPSPR
ncbi:hypothetical protein Q2K19_01065 [Micromonospora soli]|uniref:hypothetical protein n=1 Tax=Micromonospora sp. NBRC 110009 TaxID=3061627 RepID=UPI002671F02F|nr:hypothetical protein [Micromonospora sp. NBRC 110009]WKT99137.1 hypothetical protein Q2K19_01065 [Micromonospora sp. NBRC 110009]